MKLSEFNYELPSELIAQNPLEERDEARLLVLDRDAGTTREGIFRDIVDHIEPGDCLVLNDTRVISARLLGKRATGAKVEIFLIDTEGDKFRALVKPSKRIKEGETVELQGGIRAIVGGRADIGRFVEFDADIKDVLMTGHIPLPPYISRVDSEEDAKMYQTVYAKNAGATAAPTAGLHFTEKLLVQLKEKGVKICYVTLHTSYGSFAPVKTQKVEEHKMHSEKFSISEDAAEVINRTKSAGGKIISVGTTSTRVLETASSDGGKVTSMEGASDLFIYPGYRFKVVDRLITNFHLPGSTLLLLVSAFAGKENTLSAYEQAVRSSFRFFSYGDAMLVM